MSSEGLFARFVYSDLATDLADTVTSCLAHGVVVRLRLCDIVGGYRIGIGAHHLFSLLTKDLSPRFYAVVSDSLSDIVAIQAHSWHKCFIELLIIRLVLAVLDDHEERASAKTGGISNLRPVVTESLCNQGHKLVSELVEMRDVFSLLNAY